MQELTVDTPMGRLGLISDGGAITGLRWSGKDRGDPSQLLRAAAGQLAEYFGHTRQRFDLPLVVHARPLVRDVCAAIGEIPFGETRTYGEIACQIGASAQAVGQACGANPIPILIPCHRVMGAGGKLTGFSGEGGVETKVALLRHEGAGGFLL